MSERAFAGCIPAISGDICGIYLAATKGKARAACHRSARDAGFNVAFSERVVTSGWAVLPIEEPTEGVWTPIVWDSEEAEEGQESVFVVTDRRAFARLLCAQVNDPLISGMPIRQLRPFGSSNGRPA